MCGIAGIYANRSQHLAPSLLQRMNDALRHRGPDGLGTYSDEHIALGHRRLSIIDLENGSQPIFNEDGSVVVICNGEIYNYRTLRHQLETKGHRFKTFSDSESIVHAYEEYGLDCFQHFEGMFAFALWDRCQQRLVLAVDRLGIKPLVYFKGTQWLAFASELAALMRHPGVSCRLNQLGLVHYFDLGYVPGPLSIFEGIHKLLPGHYLVVEQEEIKLERYWHFPANIEPLRDYREAKVRLRGILTQTVENYLMSDVPLGAFLSGGIDSSIIVGLMTRCMTQPLKTFSIGFEDQPLLDETGYAQEIADFNGTEHYAFRLNHQDILEIIPATLEAIGEPFADYSLLPTSLLARETRRHVTVALAGDGGDELFAGYKKHRGELFQHYYYRLPSGVRRWMIHPLIHALPAARTNRIVELARLAQRFLQGVAEDQVARHVGWMRIMSPAVRSAILQVKQDTDFVEDAIASHYQTAGVCWQRDSINRMLFTDLKFELPFDMLTKVDLASMQHSLEVRVPFLDHHFVEFVFSLPGDFKLKLTQSKRILKETFADLLPPVIRKRRKQGFDLPVGEWFKHEMKDVFHDVVFLKDDDGLLDLQYIRQLYTEHCQRRADHTKLLWTVFVFQLWRQYHSVQV